MKKKRKNYDGILIPERPLQTGSLKIYGLLYNQEYENIAAYTIEEYFTWLVGLSLWVRNGGSYESNGDVWIHSDDIHSYCDNRAFRRIVMMLCTGLLNYRKLDFEKPIKINKGEVEHCWVISPSLFERIEKTEQSERTRNH